MTLVKNYSYLLCVFGFVSLLAFIIFCIPVTKLIVKGMKYDNDVEELHEEIDAIKDAFKDVNTEMADKILELTKTHRKDAKKIECNKNSCLEAMKSFNDMWDYIHSSAFVEDTLANIEYISNNSEEISSDTEDNDEDDGDEINSDDDDYEVSE